MAKYKIYATKTITLEAIIDADTELDAWDASDELITEDFDQVMTSFKIKEIVLQSHMI
jgi:hypothetical protein